MNENKKIYKYDKYHKYVKCIHLLYNFDYDFIFNFHDYFPLV